MNGSAMPVTIGNTSSPGNSPTKNQVVIAETLNVKGMMKNRRLARAIADVGWSGLIGKIEYKLRRKGGRLVKIDRWFPSSKTCSCCGSIHEGLTLSDRIWLCEGCGTLHDRDENAASNIETAGIAKAKGRRIVGLCPWRLRQSGAHRTGSGP